MSKFSKYNSEDYLKYVLASWPNSYFTIKQLLKSTGLDVHPDDLTHYLLEQKLVFTSDYKKFYPRSRFFSHGHILIRPTRREIEEGILIPGHRFIPFYNPEINPKDIILSGKHREMQKKIITWDLKDLIIFYTLFGHHNLAELLALEEEENLHVLNSLGEDYHGLIRLSAFDIGGFYKSYNFKDGDYISCMVNSWEAGSFSYRYLPAEKATELPVADWIERLDRGFEKSFEFFGNPLEPQELIAHAFFFAGRNAVKKPALHLGGYLERSNKVELMLLNDRGYLWRKGVNPEDIRLNIPSYHQQSGTVRNLDAILEDLGLSLTSSEIEAYMQSALYRGEDMDAAMARFLKEGHLNFAHKKQFERFIQYLEKLWNRVSGQYNKAEDEKYAPLRERALRIYQKHLIWLRSLDSRGIPSEALPAENIYFLADMIGKISALLELINRKEHITDELEQSLTESLDKMEKILDDEINEVEDRIHAYLSDREGKSNSPYMRKNLYTLKITIKRIRPPIWRRIRVPGNYTLGDLHDAIQKAFQWENCHLHLFLIDNEEYSDPKYSDYDIEYTDEYAYTLDDFSFQPKESFTYVYDFGDDWTHQITVESVIPEEAIPPEQRNSVVCLAGRRATPPEDCGGVYGYYSLVELLNTPLDDLDEDQLSFLEWAGDYDPEYIDLDSINRRLSRLS
ncbi:MAG: hypothetical protein DRP87_15760 [Spirochaetes bacterium]|nr:MAG: hypothetical protein DRP87_15760 [Spirochaetota bacterium]